MVTRIKSVTRMLNRNDTLRLLLIGAMSLVTTIALIGGLLVIHLPVLASFAPFATVIHAATVRPTCATTKGTHANLCEHQDPSVEGCVIDAETLDVQTVFQSNKQQKPLGEVELRYSKTCKTFWIRTTAFITAKGRFKMIHASIVFHTHTKEDIVGTPTFPDVRRPYVVWTDMTMAPLLPHGGSGGFEMPGQFHPLTIAVKG